MVGMLLPNNYHLEDYLEKLEKRVTKLEKENAELKSIIEEDNNQWDICNDLQDENIRLKDEVNKLDEGLHHHKDPHWKMFQNIQLHLEQQIKTLQDKLDKQKYLSYGEVDKIFGNNTIIDHENNIVDINTKLIITAICNLAYKPITEGKKFKLKALIKNSLMESAMQSSRTDFETPTELIIKQIAEILNDKEGE